MTSKDCGSHDDDDHSGGRKIIIWGLVFLGLILFIILVIWATLRPSKPSFILHDATLFTFNITGDPPNLLTSNFQVTLSSRNPNDNIGIYYDHLDVYATYKSQQITLPTSIPSTYQGHKEVKVWSPFVGGALVPVAPYNGFSLDQDRTRGAIELVVRIDGRVRWKVGSIITGKYHLHVRCPAFINFGNSNAGVIVGYNVVKYTLASTCSVSV